MTDSGRMSGVVTCEDLVYRLLILWLLGFVGPCLLFPLVPLHAVVDQTPWGHTLAEFFPLSLQHPDFYLYPLLGPFLSNHVLALPGMVIFSFRRFYGVGKATLAMLPYLLGVHWAVLYGVPTLLGALPDTWRSRLWGLEAHPGQPWEAGFILVAALLPVALLYALLLARHILPRIAAWDSALWQKLHTPAPTQPGLGHSAAGAVPRGPLTRLCIAAAVCFWIWQATAVAWKAYTG